MPIDRAGLGVEPLVLLLTAHQPAVSPLTGGLDILIGRRVGHTLVKGHGHIGAQMGLDAHGLLRPHEDAPPVDVRGEGDPLLGDLPQAGEGEHLKPTAVGQDRPLPVHESVEPPQVPYHLVSRPEVEVIGIGQFDLTADLRQIMGGDRPLDGPLSPYVHKHRGLRRAMSAGKNAPPGAAFGFDDFKHARLLLHFSIKSGRRPSALPFSLRPVPFWGCPL